MNYGTYISERNGVPLNTLAGYSGLFRGQVHSSLTGKLVSLAEDYFWMLGKIDYPDDEFKYWYYISDLINEHCIKYIRPYCGNGENYYYQSGFGGDESNGLIDFWTQSPVPEMPDMHFKIAETLYMIKWKYIPGGE